ncbi:hypothetical protein ACQPUY_12620 [Clostridium nigeriense]|uniref:hypothetical protein n=1 Tax=Clostridium nigeriense TaxID=1805470 RepID=UPI003D33B2F7
MDNKDLNNDEFEKEVVEENKVIEAIDGVECKEVTTEKKNGKNKEDGKGIKFLKKVLAGIIDQIISIAISLLLLIVFDLILKVIGLYIAEREPMFLIMYIIVNIFYTPICTSTKLKETIGRKIILK